MSLSEPLFLLRHAFLPGAKQALHPASVFGELRWDEFLPIFLKARLIWAGSLTF